MPFLCLCLLIALACLNNPGFADPATPTAADRLLTGELHWSTSPSLIAPLDRAGDHFYSVKDPSFVQVGGKWHVFCTVRGKTRHQQIEYLTFSDWKAADKGERHMLPITDGYFCAPQVFYFTPQKKWYLLYQYAGGSRRDSPRWPAFSTNADLGDWQHWSPPQNLYEQPGEFVPGWIDFWIICDAQKAYLFFTCDNGTFWRAETPLASFPHGWSKPVLALKGDIFEASHTYHVQGTHKYLTIIEALGPHRRYYQSYVADRLDGEWKPVDATWAKPFAGSANVTEPDGHWTDSFSHGELFRASNDQTMEIEPQGLKMLFQGVSEDDMRGKPYGEIPWRLGILSPEGQKQ